MSNATIPNGTTVSLSADEYMATCGSRQAQQDFMDGRPGYHRDASNSPSYRDAYDSAQTGGTS